MVRVPVGASRRLRWGCLALAAVVALLAVTETADARSRRKRHHVKRYDAAQNYNPPYAAIVLDAKSGAVLHQTNADSPRHPASLTKIMTLYLLFERLEAGKLRLDTSLPVSEEASIQAPTKLGLRPGQTLAVEDAIKGLVTKSANDAAVVVAEALAGSEEEFARAMTRKAQALGMRQTVYRNASGLPDPDQITTARDQAVLGIAIQERFPRYYRYFSTSSFTYHGRSIRNHNKLLGRVEGVDGIKTGYTRASGFNLVTSLRRGQRHVVGVVLGGRSGGQRDARMRDLLSTHFARASTQETRVAEAPKPEQATAPVTRSRLAAATSSPVSLAPPAAGEATAAIPASNSDAPIKPIKVKTLTVKLVPSKRPEGTPAAQPAPTPAPIAASPAPQPAPPSAPPPATTSLSAGLVAAIKEAAVPAAAAPTAVATAPAAAAKVEEPPPPARQHVPPRSGWVIQVGAFEDEAEAKERLTSARSKAATLLQKADPYTERTVKGEKTYFRARFAGFDRDKAEAVCRALKRNDIACMALKI
jgi:D-alanyl-D-alanine carboxypeptidase